jgi:hypothetical protein
MADCKYIEKCPFFHDKMQNMPSMANTYKKNFCQGDYEACARYMVCSSLGKPSVPADLFPNQQAKAKEIIAAG